MTLKFHNTLTGQVDEFVAQNENKVSLYTCGPTVYDYPHIGNWVAYIYWDTLVRILMANNYDVTRVMNITDVGHLTSDADEGEDKLEKGARREDKTAWEVAAFYTDDFIKGMKRLGMITPQYIAKATDYIPDQLNLVRRLKEKGFTYQINDGIYFDTSKFPTYADFAHLNLESLKAGARVEYNPEKRNHSDFAIWKFTPAGEKRDMEWQTPADLLDNDSRAADVTTDTGTSTSILSTVQQSRSAIVSNGTLEPEFELAPGPNSDPERSSAMKNNGRRGEQKAMGFPGWHLECSAIAMSILGDTLDIHTGGIDHIPVHHTNEIAQSEAATGLRFSNFWLHCNHIKVNGTKISKSLDNGYTLDDLEKKGFTPLDFRMFVLQGHYRNEGNFTFEGLTAAKNRLHNWRTIAVLRHQIHDTLQNDDEKSRDGKTVAIYATPHAIIEALDEDLGTPEALRIIDDAFSRITDAHLININRRALVQLLETIDSTLGLQLLDSTPDVSDETKHIILERNQARAQKDWKKSDELRDQLLNQGIAIRDTDAESIWEYKA
jgi:cysteinyl-tRNA synthetase